MSNVLQIYSQAVLILTSINFSSGHTLSPDTKQAKYLHFTNPVLTLLSQPNKQTCPHPHGICNTSRFLKTSCKKQPHSALRWLCDRILKKHFLLKHHCPNWAQSPCQNTTSSSDTYTEPPSNALPVTPECSSERVESSNLIWWRKKRALPYETVLKTGLTTQEKGLRLTGPN